MSYSAVKTIYRDDIDDKDSLNIEANDIMTLVFLTRFNDYDLGLIVLNAVGMGMKQEKLLIKNDTEEHKKLLQECIKTFLFSAKALSKFETTTHPSITFTAKTGSYGYTINETDEIIEDEYIEDEKHKNPRGYAVKHIRAGDEKKGIIGFGAYARETLSEKAFMIIFQCTSLTLMKEKNMFLSEDFSPVLVQITKMYIDIMKEV